MRRTLGKVVRQVNRDGRDSGVSAHGRVLGWLMVPMVLLVGVVTVAYTLEPEPPVVPWFETRAPGAFDPPRVAASQEWDVAFRVDALVRLPLLIAKIPIASRENVGVTTFSARYFTTDRGTGVRAYEFLRGVVPGPGARVEPARVPARSGGRRPHRDHRDGPVRRHLLGARGLDGQGRSGARQRRRAAALLYCRHPDYCRRGR